MDIQQVDKKRLSAFMNFPDKLYADDNNYVPYMKADLKKTLNKLLFKERSYTALIATDNGETVARILFTISKNKQINTEKCGFFTMFECVENQSICNAILDRTITILKKQGAEYISGTYFPEDQDNRRGILVSGFDRAPLIFTSYNKPYYDKLLTNYGLTKQTDALEYSIDLQTVDAERLKKVGDYSAKKFNFRIDNVNFNKIDDEILDVQYIMEKATNDIIFQDAPDINALKAIVKGWKRYLNKDYILIARSNVDNQPLGVVVALPDYFEAFKKMNGKTDLKGLITFAREKNKIKSLRAIMQYVIPKYQQSGVAIALYSKMQQAIALNGVNYLELGTIMEHNTQSNGAITAIGGKIARVYRIYQKKI